MAAAVAGAAAADQILRQSTWHPHKHRRSERWEANNLMPLPQAAPPPGERYFVLECYLDETMCGKPLGSIWYCPLLKAHGQQRCIKHGIE